MVWLWLQSLVLLVLTFALGLWLGHVVSLVTGQRRAPASASYLPVEEVETPREAPMPVYHGAEPMPEPEPVPVPPPRPVPVVAEPPPPPPPPRPEPIAPPPRVRAPLLFPINQFGIITVTQAPAI